MKALGNLLMVAFLITGCLAAATAYRPRTSLPDEALVDLTQTAAAGARPQTDAELAKLRADLDSGLLSAEEYTRRREALVPLVAPGESITAEQLEAMRAAGEGGSPAAPYVKVQEFSLRRWPHAWLFGLSAVGLFAGAMLVRTATKRELAATIATPGVEGASKEGDPVHALAATRATCEQLLRDTAGMRSEKEQLDAIVARLGEAQRTHLAAFVDARPRLIAKLGLGGYAEMMDRFAAGERQLNRAWSAAADGYRDEAMRCLANVPALLAEAEGRL